jgi:hypothetical protein
MNGAWLPLWIIGGPFVGLLVLSVIYNGGTSASSAVDRRSIGGSRRSTGGMPGLSTPGYREQVADAEQSGYREHGRYSEHGTYREQGAPERSDTLDLIARLSGPVSPGAIAALSGRKSPGAISSLSGRRSPGAITRLSGHKSPGAISRLSGRQSPGAIATLSAPRPVRAIASLSAGFYVSTLFGLPLLTRSQAPSEPDDTLLIPERRRGA